MIHTGQFAEIFTERCYGFIIHEDVDQPDPEVVWFHFSDLTDREMRRKLSFKSGDSIEFELVNTPKGKKAVNICVIVQPIPD